MAHKTTLKPGAIFLVLLGAFMAAAFQMNGCSAAAPPRAEGPAVQHPSPVPPSGAGHGGSVAPHLHEHQGHPPSAPSPEDQIAASLAALKQGNLAYSTPQKMKSSETAHIVARIAGGNVSLSTLESGMGGSATQVNTAPTPISTKMKMSLKSADFEITPLSSDEQIVAGDTPTTWEWDIIPKHSGALRLHLAATVELNNLSCDYAAIDREILVQVDPVTAVEKFVGQNLVWILGGTGTGLAALWAWWKKRRTGTKPP